MMAQESDGSAMGYNPFWLSYSMEMIRSSLVYLSVPVLWASYSLVECKQSPGSSMNVDFYLNHLSARFVEVCVMAGKVPTDLLMMMCVDLGVCEIEDLIAKDRYSIIGLYFERRFGIEFLRTASKPGLFVYRSKALMRNVGDFAALFISSADVVEQCCSYLNPSYLREHHFWFSF